MMPQLVRDGVVQAASCLPVARSQMRVSPMRLPAAMYLSSGLNATACTLGTWENLWTSSPDLASKILTEGSVSGAGSYLMPPARYWPVTEAKSLPSLETSDCQDQKLWAGILRICFLDS